MPMGFYTKESIHPYYTTEEYMRSDRYKSEIDSIYRIEKVLRSIVKYPQRLWFDILTALGFLRGIEKDHSSLYK
jgi:hypothetical protein